MATLVLQVPDESLVSKVKQACNMGMPAMYPTENDILTQLFINDKIIRW